MAGIVAVNYSDALFALAQEENKMEAFKESLVTMDQTFMTMKELSNVMKHPKISKEDKKKLIDDIFGECDDYVRNFAKLLIDKSRFGNFHDICSSFVALYNDFHHIEVAYIQSAVALNEDQKIRLQQMLEKKTGKHVEMHLRVNEELLAGIKVKMKDEILDNSAATRLEKMKKQVAKASLHKSEVA